MAAIEIPDELASQIEHAAQRAGQSRITFLSKAVSSYTEALEDIAIATNGSTILASASPLLS